MTTPEPQSQPESKGSDGGTAGGQTPPAGEGFKPPASQEELNRIISDRVARERAKFQDYGDLKAKASKLDALEEAQKTELEKIQARAEAAEKKAADLEAAEQQRIQKAEAARQVADWKAKIAADPQFAGVPASALRGSTEDELREHAAELKALIPDPDARRGGGAYVPAEGRQQTGTASADPRQVFADILKNA